MGYLHSVFLTLAGLSYALLFFGIDTSLGNVILITRFSLALMAPVLLGCLLLRGKSKIQLRSLKIIQMVIVLFSAFYYYFLWSSGAFDLWFGGGANFLEIAVVGFSPILGYVFLSGSIRVLARKLRVLARVGRLRD
ncbi:MAG: hypothetical protein OXE92_10065 [Bacteroidetes bacterium]|nr:hypothetical protein [Bacteroidota bacterium]MCY4206053.1 hypothetical protein [Bacteroidota bacterium]